MLFPVCNSYSETSICLGVGGKKGKERLHFSFVQILMYPEADRSLYRIIMELNKDQHNVLFTSLAPKCQLG